VSTDSDLSGIEVRAGEQLTVDAPALGQRRAESSPGWMIGTALVAFLLIVAVVLLTPSLKNRFLPQLATGTNLAAAASVPATTEVLPAVPVLWERLDLGAMPIEAARDLGQGKYYYDQRLPGNFGMAIDYWRKAQARLEAADRARVQSLVASAERELARQFSADSGDAFVLLKQGRRDEAVVLLEKMRADYLDIRAPQYIWASQMLYRRRR
jgi:hypothetical protein